MLLVLALFTWGCDEWSRGELASIEVSEEDLTRVNCQIEQKSSFSEQYELLCEGPETITNFKKQIAGIEDYLELVQIGLDEEDINSASRKELKAKQIAAFKKIDDLKKAIDFRKGECEANELILEDTILYYEKKFDQAMDELNAINGCAALNMSISCIGLNEPQKQRARDPLFIIYYFGNKIQEQDCRLNAVEKRALSRLSQEAKQMYSEFH